MKKVWGFVVLAVLIVSGLTGCSSTPSASTDSKTSKAEELRAEAEPLIGKDNKRALELLNKAIQIDPNFARAYSNRGNVYLNQKEYDRAIAEYTQAIKIDPEYSMAYSNRGSAYIDQKEYDRALIDYNQAIELDPNNWRAYNGRGLVYSYQKEYDRAIADLQQATKIEPNEKSISDLLAEVRKEKARADAAVQEEKARNEANKYDASQFIIVPTDFKPADYTRADLFAAVAAAEKLEVADEFMGFFITPSKRFVSDVVFVSQNGIYITFRTSDNAISQTMKVDSRTGLTAGQRVQIYYRAYRIKDWEVVAIKRL